ncbi:hypothetical protein CEP54_015372 [Fusarium duplospermum]|uniref:Uncharacterized protein n=1 Tax=Fusarium duplospermum TaxID=1325734 RepID=A0A428NPP8_9HYPO|nr:hypothetical protein CEP54_015372 [Fusarium duplospermum]
MKSLSLPDSQGIFCPIVVQLCITVASHNYLFNASCLFKQLQAVASCLCDLKLARSGPSAQLGRRLGAQVLCARGTAPPVCRLGAQSLD